MSTWITVCDTCKHNENPVDANGLVDGEKLADLVEAAVLDNSVPIKTRRISCLMGCKEGCNVTIQANGKLSYTIGRFEPTAEAAQGIVEYARLHADSENGQVPYRSWPDAIKGHFVTRHPPLPGDDD